MTFFKKATLAAVLGATALTAATPAMARPYNGHRGDNTGAAVAAGIFGLAVGAIIASSSNHHDYRDRYANRGWTWRDGYYWDREGRSYYRDGRPCEDQGYYNRRGYDDRGYGDYDRGYYGREGYRGGYGGGRGYGYGY